MEVFLGDSLVTFDGTIVEGFGLRENANGRVHVSALDRVEIGQTRKEGYLQIFTVWKNSPILVMFPQDQLPAAEAFAAEVNGALASG